MSLFSSIADILATNIRDLFDRADDPEETLAGAICEIELAAADIERETAKARERHEALARQLARHQTSREQWRGRVYKALDAGDLTLAVVAMGRKSEDEQVIAAIEAEQTRITAAITFQERQLAGLRAKLAEASRIRAGVASAG